MSAVDAGRADGRTPPSRFDLSSSTLPPTALRRYDDIELSPYGEQTVMALHPNDWHLEVDFRGVQSEVEPHSLVQTDSIGEQSRPLESSTQDNPAEHSELCEHLVPRDPPPQPATRARSATHPYLAIHNHPFSSRPLSPWTVSSLGIRIPRVAGVTRSLAINC